MPNYVLDESGAPILLESDAANDQKILEEVNDYSLTTGLVVAKTIVP